MNVEKFIPYEADYDTLNKWRMIEKIIFSFVILYPIIITIVEKFYFNSRILNFFDATYFISFFIYYILYIYTEVAMSPEVERKRRKGFIDNSFGSNLLEKEVKGYYSNDKISYGVYKMAINCWENCFFSLNISKEKTNKIIIRNLFLIGVVIFFAYYGFRNNKLGILVLQSLLLPLFLVELAYHFKFKDDLKRIYDDFQNFFSKIKKEDISKNDGIEGEIIFICENYEVALAYNKSSSIDSKIYQKMNAQLTKEWEEIKERYLNTKNN